MTVVEAAPDVGGMFIGIGALCVLLVFAWMFYQIARFYRNLADKDEEYTWTEIGALLSLRDKKFPEIKKALQEHKLENSKNFRKRLQEELVKEYFEKKK